MNHTKEDVSTSAAANPNPALESSPEQSNDDWLASRKTELNEIFEKKSRELGRRAQTNISERMHRYECALNKASESLESDSETQPATVTKELAKRIRQSADYFEKSEPEEILEDTAQKVKKTPFIALGAALAAGFLAGRVIASAKDSSTETGSPASL